MHPSLERIAAPLSISPECFEFSKETTATINTRIGSVSVKDPGAIQYHHDNIDDALAEVTKTRCEAAYSLGEIRSRIRDVETAYYAAGGGSLKEAERKFNGDTEHIELKMAFIKLEAVVCYCDSTEALIKNKYYEIGRKIKA